MWYFSSSTVKIDSRTRRVLAWDNNGNLKVKLLPRSRATNSSEFTWGSHEDDVLRLQGTPSDIDRYDASGYEIWCFGSSTVKIDSRTRRVMEWDNNGNLNCEADCATYIRHTRRRAFAAGNTLPQWVRCPRRWVNSKVGLILRSRQSRHRRI